MYETQQHWFGPQKSKEDRRFDRLFAKRLRMIQVPWDVHSRYGSIWAGSEQPVTYSKSSSSPMPVMLARSLKMTEQCWSKSRIPSLRSLPPQPTLLDNVQALGPSPTAMSLDSI
eukprot:4002358-Amphidinium_carterae.4